MCVTQTARGTNTPIADHGLPLTAIKPATAGAFAPVWRVFSVTAQSIPAQTLPEQEPRSGVEDEDHR